MKNVFIACIILMAYCRCSSDNNDGQASLISTRSVLQDETIKDFFLKDTNTPTQIVLTDTIKTNQCIFIIPKVSTDSLIYFVRKRILDLKYSFQEDCNNNCDISTEFLVKSYIRSKSISVLYKQSFDCKGMPSPSAGSDAYNFIKFKDKFYEVKLNINNETLQYVDSLVKVNFDKDCQLSGEVNEKMDLYFENGEFYIHNPLHSKACDEAVRLSNGADRVELISLYDSK